MIVVLYDPCPQRGTASGSAFGLLPSTELLGAAYLDRLAAQYRHLGARDVVWAGPHDQVAGMRPPTAGPGWSRLEPGSFGQDIFGRYETVIIADYRLWPESGVREAILRHKRSESTLTAFGRSVHRSDYLELVMPQTDDGCVVIRRYGAKADSSHVERCVALLARPKALPAVWARVVRALASGDLDCLASIARGAQLQVEGNPILIETVDDYLALTAKLLAHAGDLVPEARRLADGIWAMPGAVVEGGSRIRGPVLLGRGCRIAEGASIEGPAVVGDSVTVGPASLVGESVLMAGAQVPQGAHVWRSVVEGGAALLPSQALSFAWVGRDARRRYIPTKSGIGFSSVVVPSRGRLRRCRVFVYAAAKRLIDIAGALVGLAITLPLYPFIALAMKREGPGPVFFVHQRQTLGGKEFGCLKFRSMVPNAQALRNQLKNEVDGPQFHIENDQRLTRLGKFLRRTNLDEVPQFWNVLLGHMSLVGPRPSPDDENQFCPAWREARLSVRPGLTGMWQVRRTDRAGGDFHQWIQYDTQYVREASLLTDLKIIWGTVGQLLRRV